MKNKIVRILLITFTVLILGLGSALMVIIGLAPTNTVNKIITETESDSLFCSNYDTLYNQPALSTLIKEKTYKSALQILSKSDSIQMTVQLNDSAVCLYLKGIKLHQTKVSQFEINTILQHLPMREYLFCFSKPLPIITHRATIVKEPVVERHAPKDTIEAAAYKPDTLIQDPAYVELFLPHNIHLVLLQAENDSPEFMEARASFLEQIKNRELYLNLQQVKNKQKTTQYPIITIELPAEDLRAVYRALPHFGLVVIGY